MVRRAIHRSDGNQAAIVRDLRKMGYAVAVLSHAGDGFPDLLIAARNNSMLVEIKDPLRAAKDQLANGPYSLERQDLLEPAQKKFAKAWPLDIPICFSLQEVMECFEELEEWTR